MVFTKTVTLTPNGPFSLDLSAQMFATGDEQVRRYLNVRPKVVLPESGLIQVDIQLSSQSGLLMVPVRATLSLTKPLNPEMRELHLNQVQRALEEAAQIFVRDYSDLLEVKTAKKSDKPSVKKVERESPEVVTMYPGETDPQVSAMLDQTKARPKEEELLEPQEQ